MQFYADEFQPRTKLTHEQHCKLLKGPPKQHIAKTYGLDRDSIKFIEIFSCSRWVST